jgi:hypothetical protein
VPGVRPDFVDLNNRIIYELKPNNPRAIRAGGKQLKLYQEAYQAKLKKDWKIVLDLYDENGKIWTEKS